MPNLDPDASALLRVGRTAFRSSASDRERVLRSLTRTLGDGAVVEESSPVGSANDTVAAGLRFRVSAVFGCALVLAVGAGVLLASHRWGTSPSQARATQVAASSPPPEPAPTDVPPSPSVNDRAPQPPQIELSSTPRSSPRPAARPVSDPLAEEVRLLSRAERLLNDGASEDALRALGEHERRFPKGALTEERMAAQVQALCALGRIVEARTDLTRLALLFPKSAHTERVRRFCGKDIDSVR